MNPEDGKRDKKYHVSAQKRFFYMLSQEIFFLVFLKLRSKLPRYAVVDQSRAALNRLHQFKACVGYLSPLKHLHK